MSKPNLAKDFLVNTIDPSAASKSFAWINIFYKQLSYEISTETAQLNLVLLCANIGGYLSLFLGVSLLSFFELVQLCVEIVLLRVQKSQNRIFINVK
jgi:hypothetical protein